MGHKLIVTKRLLMRGYIWKRRKAKECRKKDENIVDHFGGGKRGKYSDDCWVQIIF